ncbi:hypothetical protein QYI97_13470 [Lacticaseibacillus paracasei]|uniref:hypothetical protein n=1 Tax=Lacticaseibacillus paracasei TaxID=1597 RepID=UPI00234B5F5C|nr:hypothetical protein [Lacticaseibacillus paracasei]MDC6274352.1 hypothetical protein [Lacticaseibacillus paracasei]MDN4555230.1 hypothetical protein [Lacticaseibacillus paracasei]
MVKITVKSYKFGDQKWTNFKGSPIKKYENAILLDISDCDAFTTKEKIELNHKIVVPISVVKERDVVKNIPLSKLNDALIKAKNRRKK